jgi:hypothetical protein
MNIKSKFQSLTAMERELVRQAIYGTVFSLLTFAAIAYGDLNLNNPFLIVSCYVPAHVLIRLILNDLEGEPASDIKKGFSFGSLKLTMGALLALFVCQTDNQVEGAIWAVVALGFIEYGIKGVVRSSILLRKKYKKRVAELMAMNERARIEQEIAARWEAEEIQRKQKADMEQELLTDLSDFLGSAGPSDLR